MTAENGILAFFVLGAVVSLLAFRRVVRGSGPGRTTASAPDRRALLRGNALALGFLIFSGASAGEIYYRFAHDTTDSFGITKTTRAWLARHYQRNEQGFRDSVEYPVAADETAAERRITFLGDSFLAGYGVDDVEDRFANLLRRTRSDWQIEALARLGADTQAEIDTIERWILEGRRLETVVLVYVLNDIQAVAPEAAAHDARIRAHQQREPPLWMRHSFLLDRLYFAWRVARDPALGGYFDFLGRAYRGVSWLAQAERLDTLLRVVEDAGGELRVVTFPFLHAKEGDRFLEAHAQLDAFWRARGVPHLDLRELFARDPDADYVVNARDAHPNEAAHALAARAIDPFLAAAPDRSPAARRAASRFASAGERSWPATDVGPILAPGLPTGSCREADGRTAPGDCDHLGARDAWLFEHDGRYTLHYDAIGATGWRSALASSEDLIQWRKRGPILALGKPGSDDAAAAAYGVPYFDGASWHLFYLGTPNASAAPERIPAFPYLTRKAIANSPEGPWRKQPGVAPLTPRPGTWYSETSSPGPIVRRADGSYLQIFSGAAQRGASIYRTLGIARTRDLDSVWEIDPDPILPPTAQVENASLYFEPSNDTWFLFTNRVHAAGRYTDAIVVYWSRDLEHWDPANRAVVLDGRVSRWSKGVIGLPSVLAVGDRLAIVYDGIEGRGTGHVGRSLGLAWMTLPLVPPNEQVSASARIGASIRWEMNDASELAASQQLALRFEDGVLEAQRVAPDDDPFVVLAGAPVHASRYDRLRFRARLASEPGTTGSIYYFFEGSFDAIGFPLVPGWHTYEVDLGRSANWAGRIDRLRLDPQGVDPSAVPDAPGSVAIDWILLGSGRPVL